MRIKRLNGMFTISTQIEVNKIEKLHDAGYRAIICNRPDGEGEDQPSFERVAARAKAYGIEVRYIPVALSGASAQDLAAFAKAITEMPKPILAYCRSGTRSATLFSQWEMSTQSTRRGETARPHGERPHGERRRAALDVGAMAPGNTSVAGQKALIETRGAGRGATVQSLSQETRRAATS